MFWRHKRWLLAIVFAANTVDACEKPKHPPFNKIHYYQNLNILTGSDLKSALNRRIGNHTFFPYTPCTWRILEEADRDPNRAKHVIGLYTRRSIPVENYDRGNNDPNAWNREHTWPKNRGFPSRRQRAFSDTHMLFASDKSVNSDRYSLDFDWSDNPHHECKQCQWDKDSWEPPNEVKGDIARALFYADTRYEGKDDSGVPDLTISKYATRYQDHAIGKLCTLLAWHQLDPVSEREKQRVEVIYSWQGNRNPFVDHPEFVEKIWAKECD